MNAKTIVVNARMLRTNRLDGTGWFAFETLRRMVSAHPAIQFHFLFDRPFDERFLFSDRVTGTVLPPPIRHGLLYYPWYQMSVKRYLERTKPDLFLSPDGLLPLGAKIPMLSVIHDLNFHHYPKDLPLWTRHHFVTYYPRSAEAATRIATVSEYTKQDIVERYHIAPDHIDVVGNGIRDGFVPLSDTEKQHVRNEYTNGHEYFIFVGSLHPRKNIPRLIEAFGLFKKKTASPLKLIIAGAMFWGKNILDEALAKIEAKKDIVLTGRTNDEVLTKLMAAATALTYVPYFEGFGVPLIEAMQCDVPILAANTTSVPEVAGQAALYVDPFDVDAIAEAMKTLATSPERRAQLIAGGKIERQKFSWDKTAERLWRSIEQTYQG